MSLRALIYDPGSPESPPSLKILNQLLLPHQTVYVSIRNSRAAYAAIKKMLVRGAPAIALVAALALAVEDPYRNQDCFTAGEDAHEMAALEKSAPSPQQGPLHPGANSQDTANWYASRLEYLVQSRPTAVNLADGVRKLCVILQDAATNSKIANDVRVAYAKAVAKMLEDDVLDNKNIGREGKDWIIRASGLTQEHRGTVLTHCNTGSLATAGYGTALGVIRSLHEAGVLRQVYYTETRPYNQGSRLTGFELLHDQIPAILITDSMAASLFRLKAKSENIVAIIVGADRVAANGDTANKIGTYALASLARQHGIHFLVAAPRTTIDIQTASGDDIVIEERPQSEVLAVNGPVVTAYTYDSQEVDTSHTSSVSTAAPGTKAWNPAFDVTPADLIDGIVTEIGVAEKRDGRFNLRDLFPSSLRN